MGATFEGKCVIVTGASRGVGRAVAERLVEEGARVMLADNDESRLKEFRAKLGGANGRNERIARFTCDVSQKFGVNNLLAATLDAYDRLDAVITTTQDFERADPMSLTAEALDRVLASNVRAAFLLSQTAAHRMVALAEKAGEERAAGAIVHVSSLSGQLPAPEIAAYAISCAALDQVTRAMAAALASHGIRVNGVAPGSVMTENLLRSVSVAPELRRSIVAGTPLGRIGDPTEAAEAALFLASDKASFITGQVLTVDGGRSVLDPLAVANL